jgi:hypothetical protein
MSFNKRDLRNVTICAAVKSSETAGHKRRLSITSSQMLRRAVICITGNTGSCQFLLEERVLIRLSLEFKKRTTICSVSL